MTSQRRRARLASRPMTSLVLASAAVACGGSGAAPLPAARDAAASPSLDATTRHDTPDAHPDDALRDARTATETSGFDAGPPPNGPALPVAPMGHEGRWLTDMAGRVVLVHGVNVVAKEPPYYPSSEGFSDADATWLANAGLRVVRVGMLATGLMPTPGVVDGTYVDHIVATVHDLAEHDIFSVLDLHQDGWGPEVGSDGFPAWMTLTGDARNVDASFPTYYEDNPALQQAFQSFWDGNKGSDGRALEDNYASMFGAVAKALAGERHVLGYDLLNEPWPGTTWEPCLASGGCPSLDERELAPAYAKAAAAIRSAGDEHLIFGEPFVLFNFGGSATSVPLPGGDSNSGLSFHVYPLSATGVPAGIAEAVAWSTRTQGALLNTEWGATTDTTTLVDQSLALDSAFVPWIFWSFCCELVPTFDAAPGGTNVVPSTLAALVQAYPLAVAGKPESLDLDPKARTLHFTWSTARVGGGNFATGAVTTFEAPALTYPEGYTVTVSHGWVTSTPCAPLVTVAAAPGETSVSVSIRPGGVCP